MSKSISTKKLYQLDESSLVEFVERYRAPLLYFVTGFLGDLAEAEDVVSETIVKLLVKKPFLREEGGLKTYLYKTAKHFAIDRLRKRKRERQYLETATRLADSEILYIDEQLATTEEKQVLVAALRLLTPEYRQVLYFYYFEDLSIAKICQILKKSKKQVYNLLARAKAALSVILTKEGVRNEI